MWTRIFHMRPLLDGEICFLCENLILKKGGVVTYFFFKWKKKAIKP